MEDNMNISICRNGTYYHVGTDGCISYTHADGFKVQSSDWRLVGAVEYKTVFGNTVVVRHYTFKDIVEKKVPWKYKNGKQRCYVKDYDHGSFRVWGNDHSVMVS